MEPAALGSLVLAAALVVRAVTVTAAVAVAHRRRAGEAVALVVVDELVIGHAALVQTGLLLMKLGLRALRLRLALGDPRALLGLRGLAVALLGLAAVLAGHVLASLRQLAFALAHTSPSPHARHHESEERDDDQSGDDDGDDRASGHEVPPSRWG